MLNENNYIRESVQSNYSVEFDFKGIEFNENLIIEALSDYFDSQYHNNIPAISLTEFKRMFDYHQEVRNEYDISLIKRICINYEMKILKTIDFM